MGIFNTKTFAFLVDSYKDRRTSDTEDQMKKQMVLNTVNDICGKYLKFTDDVLTFEAEDADTAQLTAEVINEEPLVLKYSIAQVSEYLFQARLRSLSFDDSPETTTTGATDFTTTLDDIFS